MKSRILAMTVMAIVSTLFVGASARAVDEPAGLVGRWEFDDGTGKDLSGNGNDAVLGGARAYSLGAGHGCIEIAPNAEPMRIPTSENSPLAIARGTICFWMSVSTDSSGILEFDNGAVQLNNYRGCFQVRFAGENRFRFWDKVLDYDWPKYDLREWTFYPHIKASVGDAEWHLFAVAYDYEGMRIVGWRDGELISVVDLSKVDIESLRRDGLAEISTGEGLVGYLDDLRIYNRVLTDTEVRRIYNSTKSVYASRRDTPYLKRKSSTYKYRVEDRTLYRAWLQYGPPARPVGQDLFKNIVAEGSNSTVQTAASELIEAIESMFASKPSVKTVPVSGPQVVLGTADTSTWIREHAGQLKLDRIKDDGFVIKSVDDGGSRTLVVAGAVPAGVIFGTFDLIRRIQLGQDPRELDVLENPQVPIRMIDHWSFFRGTFGDRWRIEDPREDSIYSWEELRTGDTKLIRDWVRMMASAGWNAICPSEVNWHYNDNFLEHLDEVEILAGILRDYGMKLYWTPSYLLALEQATADQLYERVPDFGGYMLKVGSEKQNGDPRPPMVNRMADTLKQHGGMLLLRTFIYGNRRYSPKECPNLLPYDTFAPEDGNFRDNVLILSKTGAGDWDFSAPIVALDGAIQKNLYGSEQVIDKEFLSSWVEKWKWWFEQDNYWNGPGSLNKYDVDCLMGVAMISPSPAWTTSALNMVNYYGLARLAWNPDRTLDEIYTEWATQTFGPNPVVVNTVKNILLMSDDVTRKHYTYRGYRGVAIQGYRRDRSWVQNKQPHAINPNGIGPAIPELQERVLNQYSPGLREVYGDPIRGEQYLPTFFFVEHDRRLTIGRTLIQDVYGNMEEAVTLAEQMAALWKTLEGKIDTLRFEETLKALVGNIKNAQNKRDELAASIEANTGRKREEVISGLTASSLASVGTYNVRHFGAVGDGTGNDAEAINTTIDACNAAGGGTVFVPSGIYATGSIHLKSNVTLAIDDGAVLRALAGAMDPWEPNPNDKGLMDSAYYHWEASLIWGKDLENVKIYGPGTLDGSALTRSSKVPEGTGDKGIALKGCKNVEIRNLNINEGGHYAILATGCEDMLIDNVTINTSRDGINLIQCSNVEVAYCHIDSVRYEDGQPVGGDDAIKFGSDMSLGKVWSSKNVSVHDCFLAAGCNGLQFGDGTVGPFKDYRFENIRIRRAGKAGISIMSNDGSKIEDIHFKNIRMEKTYVPFFIKISDVARVPEGTYKRGSIRDITFENVTVTDSYSYLRGRETSSMIWGKPETPIEGIEFKNVSIIAKGGHPVTDAEVQPPENDEKWPRHVGTLPAYAWYLRHVKDVHFADCEFGFEQSDGRPAIVIDEGERVVLDHTTLPIGSMCSSRIAVRGQTKDFTVRNCEGMRDILESASDRHY